MFIATKVTLGNTSAMLTKSHFSIKLCETLLLPSKFHLINNLLKRSREEQLNYLQDYIPSLQYCHLRGDMIMLFIFIHLFIMILDLVFLIISPSPYHVATKGHSFKIFKPHALLLYHSNKT